MTTRDEELRKELVLVEELLAKARIEHTDAQAAEVEAHRKVLNLEHRQQQLHQELMKPFTVTVSFDNGSVMILKTRATSAKEACGRAMVRAAAPLTDRSAWQGSDPQSAARQHKSAVDKVIKEQVVSVVTEGFEAHPGPNSDWKAILKEM